MLLTELLGGAGIQAQVIGATSDVAVSGISVDSTRMAPGWIFAALPGRRSHGAEHVKQAVGAGAVAVLTDDVGARSDALSHVSVPVIVVEHARTCVASLAVTLWNAPATKMSMLAVTGTNGKTTVTHLLQAALQDAGVPCGILGTLGARTPDGRVIPHARTTPEAPELQALLATMVDAGARAVAMEVSSIALCEHRVDGIEFDVAAFTGLTQDHLDYHGSMDAYFEAKADLFTQARARQGLVVVDDVWGRRLVETCAIPITTVSVTGDAADWTARRDGDDVVIEGPQSARVRLVAPSDFALANLALAVAVAHTQGVSVQEAAESAARARVPGRMEVVGTVQGIDFVVDYAHTPDAVDRVVSAAAAHRRAHSGRVIVVVGAGGDRDPGKRVEMGRAAGAHADLVIVTDDNPRSEDPIAIRRAVIQGVKEAGCPCREIPARRDAIEAAVHAAAPHDVVLVLGKGHETTQEIGDHVLAFDDRQVLASFVEARFGAIGEVGG